MSLTNTAGDNLKLKQLILLRKRSINGRLHSMHSTLKITHVKTIAKARIQELVSNIQGSHYGDAFNRDNLAKVTNFAHFFIEIGDGFQQFGTFVILARNAKLPVRMVTSKVLTLSLLMVFFG